MNNDKTIAFLLLYLSVLLTPLNTQMRGQSNPPAIWTIDRTDSIGGFPAIALAKTPLIQNGAAVFDGVNDGLLVQGNPASEHIAVEVDRSGQVRDRHQ